jgi:diguanylate cyclase (GGDEF)-like protein
LRIKITLLVVSLIAAASIAFGRFAYSGIGDVLTNSIGLGAETAAQALADSVDGAWLKGDSQGTDTSSDSYRKLSRRFRRPIDSDIVTLVQLVRLDHSNRKVIHVIDLAAFDTGDDPAYKPGATETFADAPMYNETTPGHDTVLLPNRPELFMAGWAPIVDGNEQVGLMIVTTDMSGVVHTLQTIGIGFVIAIAVLVLVSGLAAFKFASTFEKTAVTDGLMGIYNHKYFKQRLEEEVAKSRRYKQQTSLVLLDIDFFKRVNDTYGHATGDIVLKNLAKWVTDTCRNTDVSARYGGEEIAVILPYTSIAGAQEFAERLRLKVSQQVVRDPEEKAEFRVTVSIGVAQWEQGLNAMDMIKRTDAALYHSKHMGRNRVTIYQEDILPAPETPQVAEKR